MENNAVVNIPIRIKNLLLTETGGYQEQYIRPYQADLRPHHVDTLERLIDQRLSAGSSKIDPSVISQALPDAIMPTTAPVRKAEIVGGWSESRFRFNLIAESTRRDGMGIYITYLSGYSDYLGVTMRGTIDPNMKLFINNVIVIEKIYNARTQRYITRILGHYQLVHQSGGYALQNVDPYGVSLDNILSVATPEAVVGMIISKDRMGDMADLKVVSESVLDQQGERAVSTNTGIMLPTDYLANIATNTMGASLNMTHSFPDHNDIDLLTNVSSVMMSANDISNIPFFRKLIHVNGFHADRPYVTIAELELMDPTLRNSSADRVTVIRGNRYIREDMRLGGMEHVAPEEFFSTTSEDPGKVTEEARMATYLAEAMTALMTKYALFDITISATNITGQPVIKVMSTSTVIPDLDPVAMSARAEMEFINNIFPTLTKNNQMVVEIFGNSTMTGDTNITISINGDPLVKYTFPKAADALYNPLIQTEQTMDRLTNAVSSIIDIAKDKILY